MKLRYWLAGSYFQADWAWSGAWLGTSRMLENVPLGAYPGVFAGKSVA